jgi:TolA-binding protein
MMACFGGFIAMVIALGVLCAFDISHYFGERAKQWFLQGGAPIHSAPEFEAAEKLRASGQPLEAVSLLREFLQSHPGEVHVMSRIAEIYNYDLKNYLAAALEYEELLKHRLDPEQWGWAALHLAKLYGRLNEPDKSLALLDQLQKKYGKTVAARRAKKALDQLQEPESDDESG